MKVEEIAIRNFRRLTDVRIVLEDKETVFVGANNSGKTSVAAAFRCFLAQKKFRIHDFSAPKVAIFNEFEDNPDGVNLPSIDLDIWFRIDPENTEFNRISMLLTELNKDVEKLGIRLQFCATNPKKLHSDFLAFKSNGAGYTQKKNLTNFLMDAGNLSRFYEITYAALDRSSSAFLLDSIEGRKLIDDLIKVDFIDAQRKMEDDEGNRSNRLSSAFMSYYRSNLERLEIAAKAHEVIEKDNERRTSHYSEQFKDLHETISELGFPSSGDRKIEIISNLNTEKSLSDSIGLEYVDANKDHRLPEAYNGLGFKNLVYMVIQARHYNSQRTRSPRTAMFHLMFIEEPEVHLHVQVQKVFINRIWNVINKPVHGSEEKFTNTQIIITTHSPHILDASDFRSLRYFQRHQKKFSTKFENLDTTNVQCLREFQNMKYNTKRERSKNNDVRILRKHLRLTHCDLFFADAAILVEGLSEKLLMPDMIDKSANELNASYITVLEVGGAHVHVFDQMLSLLKIPFLIITDLDSVDPNDHRKSCRADSKGAVTSNGILRYYFKEHHIVEKLIKCQDKIKVAEKNNRYIAFQGDVSIEWEGKVHNLRPRTLEETLIYENYDVLRNEEILSGIPNSGSIDNFYQAVYEKVKSGNIRKSDFAINILDMCEDWSTPKYIEDGLLWLQEQLNRR